MWRPGGRIVLLFLILDLSPQPGVSQGVHQYCQKCRNILTEANVKPKFKQILIKNGNYTVCPNNIIKFELPSGTFCGTRLDSWVDKVTNCIDQGRNPCLSSNENQQDFSKGSKDEPLTTTQESTTSTAKTAATLRLFTHTWKGGTSKPSETTTEELGTTGSNQNNNQLHGNEAPTEKIEEKGKMKQMTIAIISLLLIVLVMTAAGMYVWCRRARCTECKGHCPEETVKYQQTPSEEP